jgi:hypothetical protein
VQLAVPVQTAEGEHATQVSVIVRRGEAPMAPRSPLPLQMPAGAQQDAQQDTDEQA